MGTGRLRRGGLTIFGRLPRAVRRRAVRWGTASFTVGAVCVLRCDGSVLLIRQPHHAGLTLPGGLLRRGEEPRDALRREVAEEVGIELDVDLPTTAVVDQSARRVDLVYVVDVPTRPAVRPDRVEVTEFVWRPPDDAAEAGASTRRVLAAAAAR